MDKQKKPYIYVKDAVLLFDSEGKIEKIKKEADDIIRIIKQINPDIGKNVNNDNTNEEKTNKQKKTNTEDTDWKEVIIQAFKDGPLKWKPTFDTCHKSNCDKSFKSDILEKTNEFHGSAVIDKKYSGSLDAEIKAESEGHARLAVAKTKVAEAKYSAHFKGKLKASIEGITDEHNTEKGFEKQSTVGICKVEGEIDGKLKGSAQLNFTERGKLEAEMNMKTSGEASLLGSQVCLERNSEEIKRHMKVLQGKATGKTEIQTKVSSGKHRAVLKAKAEGKAEIQAFDGKLSFKPKESGDGSFHIKGVEATIGKAEAQGKAEIDFQTDICGVKNDKKGKVSGQASLRGVKLRAMSKDIVDKKDYGNEMKASVGVQGLKAKVLNFEATGEKTGNKTSLSAEVTGAKVNVGNFSATKIDNRKINSVKASPGFSLNAGNINATGLGHKGLRAEADGGLGGNMFNVSTGLARDSGATVQNGVSFCNVNLTIGVPSLNIGFGIKGCNISIPFLSGGGGGEGGDGSIPGQAKGGRTGVKLSSRGDIKDSDSNTNNREGGSEICDNSGSGGRGRGVVVSNSLIEDDSGEAIVGSRKFGDIDELEDGTGKSSKRYGSRTVSQNKGLNSPECKARNESTSCNNDRTQIKYNKTDFDGGIKEDKKNGKEVMEEKDKSGSGSSNGFELESFRLTGDVHSKENVESRSKGGNGDRNDRDDSEVVEDRCSFDGSDSGNRNEHTICSYDVTRDIFCEASVESRSKGDSENDGEGVKNGSASDDYEGVGDKQSLNRSGDVHKNEVKLESYGMTSDIFYDTSEESLSQVISETSINGIRNDNSRDYSERVENRGNFDGSDSENADENAVCNYGVTRDVFIDTSIENRSKSVTGNSRDRVRNCSSRNDSVGLGDRGSFGGSVSENTDQNATCSYGVTRDDFSDTSIGNRSECVTGNGGDHVRNGSAVCDSKGMRNRDSFNILSGGNSDEDDFERHVEIRDVFVESQSKGVYEKSRDDIRNSMSNNDSEGEMVLEYFDNTDGITYREAKTSVEVEEEEVYNKYFAGLVAKGIGNSKRSEKSEKTQPLWHDKDALTRALIKKYAGNSGYKITGKGSNLQIHVDKKTNAKEGIRADDDTSDSEAAASKEGAPKKKGEPKKPFGESKNIHTIFTLGATDARPIHYLKGNVACFGDD